MHKLLATALTCAALTGSAFASTPWDGTWKLDLNKSHLTGPSFTYSKTANGVWHYTDGAISFDFAPDGKPYKTISPDDTLSVTANGDHELTLVSRFKDKVRATTQETLSPDGKTLTDRSSGTRPDGTKFDDSTVYTRVSGASGFAGKWKSTKVSVSVPDSWIISSGSDGTINWDLPGYKETVHGKPDGTPLPITGPTVSAGMTVSIKQVSPHRMDYTVALNGKAIGEGYQTLAADGKSFTDVSWTPGQQTEKTTGVFVKQ
ncbi:MAG TPA: hypothetical protein VIJ65_07795 [Acidobacteriaceae bacterium]